MIQGVRSAPTGTVSDATDDSLDVSVPSLGTHMRVPHAVFCGGRTQWVLLSAAAAKNRMGNAHVCTENNVRSYSLLQYSCGCSLYVVCTAVAVCFLETTLGIPGVTLVTFRDSSLCTSPLLV